MFTKNILFPFSKFDDSGDVLVDQALVVGLQGLDVWDLSAFRVKVENAEKSFQNEKSL
jgi:hypothetical protein